MTQPMRWLTTTLLLGLWLSSAQAQQSTRAFDEHGQCVGDGDGDGAGTIDEVVGAVNNALYQCDFEPITLRFKGMVGDRDFACGQSYENIGTTQATLVPSDFRLYLSNVRLVTSDYREVPVRLEQDHRWQVDDIVLIDFEDKQRPCTAGTAPTNSEIHASVAPGSYRGVRFTLGVPFARNHDDQAIAPSPLNLSGLFWSWQDGYKFMRIDTAFDNLRVHLGSTGCSYSRPNVVAGCARPNRAEIWLDDFDPSRNVIVADLAALLADSDLTANQPDTPPGCMSDPNDDDCEPIMRNLGVHFANGQPVPALQKFFRVE
jgi:uncharacterized repeat protein (TIGR04052 family)